MRSNASNSFLRPLLPHLARSDVKEIVVNQPQEVGLETKNGWVWETVDDLTFDVLMAMAKSLAGAMNQDVTPENPVCSSVLPEGERVQILIPPAVPEGTVSLTIRKPSSLTMSLADMDDRGLFSRVEGRDARHIVSENDRELLALLDKGDWVSFLKCAVVARKNILISGATGSGKTSLSKALLHLIPPHERILTIEDTRELSLPHRNVVHMTYPKDGNGMMRIGAKELLESALRMRPDRIMLQELRDGTAFYYLRNVNSGHPGSITTVHANSARGALEQLTLLVKESEGGHDLTRDDIRGLLRSLVDIVIQMKCFEPIDGRPAEYRATEIFFEPPVVETTQ